MREREQEREPTYSFLENALMEMLAAASAPLSASRLILWTHTHIPGFQFSWDEFSDSLNRLKAADKVVEDATGFSLKPEPVPVPEETEQEREAKALLRELGIGYIL
jgi:hypothetical protein